MVTRSSYREIDYLLVGHITKDLTESGPILGGTVTYASPDVLSIMPLMYERLNVSAITAMMTAEIVSSVRRVLRRVLRQANCQ